MANRPAIKIPTERQRVQVEERKRQLDKTPVRYLSDAERDELRSCNQWLKKNARAWERK